jgi:hypothetical protein
MKKLYLILIALFFLTGCKPDNFIQPNGMVSTTTPTKPLVGTWLLTIDCGKKYYNIKDVDITVNENKCNRFIATPNGSVKSNFYFKETKLGKENFNVNVEAIYVVKDFAKLINDEHRYPYFETLINFNTTGTVNGLLTNTIGYKDFEKEMFSKNINRYFRVYSKELDDTNLANINKHNSKLKEYINFWLNENYGIYIESITITLDSNGITK